MIKANNGEWAYQPIAKCGYRTMQTVLSGIATDTGRRLHDERQAPLQFAICRDPFERALAQVWQVTKDVRTVAMLCEAGVDPENIGETYRYFFGRAMFLFLPQSHVEAGIVDEWIPLGEMNTRVPEILGLSEGLPHVNKTESDLVLTAADRDVIAELVPEDLRFVENA